MIYGLAFMAGFAFVAGGSKSFETRRSAGLAYQKRVKPVLTQYCYSCHGSEKRKGGLSLEAYADLENLFKDRKVWAEVSRKLHMREMPPEGKPQPSEAQREMIASWIESTLFPIDCDDPDPGRVTIRRLNRDEYNNTIRDLLGVNFSPADDFPADDTGYGFDNIGDVLSMSPLLLEKYLAAAGKILSMAIVVPESATPPKISFSAADFGYTGGGTLNDSGSFSLYSTGEVFVTNAVPSPGAYRLRIVASGQQAGPEPVKMALRLDGKQVRVFDVEAGESSPQYYEFRTVLDPARHRIALAFINDYYNPKDPNPANRDRNLLLHRLELSGPLDASPAPLTEAHLRIFTCRPQPATTNECARTIISGFIRRAFRRPATDEEVTRLVALSEAARNTGASFELSIKIALQAVLVSPHFLFRGELQAEPNNPKEISPIDEHGLASRLSYFLWSSMPDEELFALADKGALRKNLERQVRRMLRDPKAGALVRNFGGQWLQTRTLREVAPDPGVFPAFNNQLRTDMATETETLFAYIMNSDRSVLEFLTADYSFINDRLARHYGIKGISGPEFRRVSLKGTVRSGVLTHASILTLTSNPTRTSPVKRGKWVLENLLAQAPPPPPPGVPPLNEGKEEAASASLRKRMERHREDPLCASCHSLMDPIGFGLENFDGIGAWREQDGSFPIDASGRLNTGESFSGAKELRQVLTSKKQDQFVRCLAEKMLTYALGRGLEPYDRCAVDKVTAFVERNDHKFSALVFGVVNSVPFQMRRGEGERVREVTAR